MNPKDFAMGEAEHVDYTYRLPLYSTMELFIETLTGTCFELRVSPYEPVISVKAKIQRLEGIPISQQFLIWQNVELEDDYCLHDYNITDGCTLKLVLAMRGGPINTRRIAMEEPGFCEMADYIDSNKEELLEKASPPPSSGNGSKQVTLLVYRDGDQLNFFRVVDRGDGTLTPFSESLSGSACNLHEMEEEDDSANSRQMQKSSSQQPLSVAQMVENNITAAKMKKLRSQMQNLHFNTATTTIASAKTLSAIQATPIVRLESRDKSRSRSSKYRNKLDQIKITDHKKNTKLPIKVPDEEKSRVSDAKMEKQSDNCLPECTPPSENLVGETGELLSYKVNSISRTEFRRSQLKRMKSVNNSQEISEEINLAPLPPSSSDKDNSKRETEKSSNDAKPDKGLVKSEAQVESKSNEATTDSKDDGRFSPRTRRLLNALENNSTKRRPTNTVTTTAYRSPRSTLLQGMTFNRHDMYLRSYGLIASPDETADEEIASPPSDTTPPPVKLDEPPETSSKLYETAQGVKYSSLGPSKQAYFGTGSRFLKSPPSWAAQKDSAMPALQAGTWHQTIKSPQQQEPPRYGERLLRPPSSSKHNIPSHVSHQKSMFDSMLARTSKNLQLSENNATTSKSSSATKQWRKLDSMRLPQPPSSFNNSLATPSWQKQRFRRLNLGKLPSEVGDGLPTVLPDIPTSSEPLASARQSFRRASSRTGLRMKEPQHGKVESMSREEAREVVDFINKAVDASILRTLVRSPVKEGQRGSSGQTSHRMSGSSRRDGSVSQSSLNHHPNNRQTPGPQALPPVKPPTKKKRCFLCAKRTGLASSYICRCGNNFCATHRYAETHNCTYDYKTSGRKLLEEANPLVSAPKLPKI